MFFKLGIFSTTQFAHRINTKRLGTMPLRDKLFVNYLEVPKFMRIHGPTGEEVTKDLDLTNKTCLITGGTTGIGAEMVRCLITRNCNVVMACRNPYAATIALKTMWRDPSKLATYKANFTSLKSVKDCTDKILRDQKKIDIVIVNAAVFGLPWIVTEDKLETTFQVNFLSQFYFLMNIEKILAPDARVVFMSSESHRNLKWSLTQAVHPNEDMLSLPKDSYTSIKAYNVSKVCGILAMHYLNYRWRNQGRSVFCAHPGSFIKTKLCSNWWVYEALYTIMIPFTKSIKQGAATPLYCATSPELQGLSDLYFKDCKEVNTSDLASNNHLTFRIIDVARDMLRERVPLPDEEMLKSKRIEYQKPTIEKPETVKPESQTEEAQVLSA